MLALSDLRWSLGVAVWEDTDTTVLSNTTEADCIVAKVDEDELSEWTTLAPGQLVAADGKEALWMSNVLETNVSMVWVDNPGGKWTCSG